MEYDLQKLSGITVAAFSLAANADRPQDTFDIFPESPPVEGTLKDGRKVRVEKIVANRDIHLFTHIHLRVDGENDLRAAAMRDNGVLYNVDKETLEAIPDLRELVLAYVNEMLQYEIVQTYQNRNDKPVITIK